MPWKYSIPTGQLFDPNGRLVAIGYSGHGAGLNNPIMQSVADIGPIPAGSWEIGAPYDSSEHGPYTLPLTPLEGTETFGRSEFKSHGDEIDHPGQHLASLGCLIVARFARFAMWNSADRVLEVTS